jgi:electron transfer flavoprotein beta subunit
MAAKKKPIEEAECTPFDAALKISARAPPAPRSEGKRIDGDPAAQAASLIALLREEAKII